MFSGSKLKLNRNKKTTGIIYHFVFVFTFCVHCVIIIVGPLHIKAETLMVDYNVV